MSTRTQALLLLIFGATIARLACSQELMRYVRPGARLRVAMAAMVVLWLALAGLRGRHALGSRAGWLLLAPFCAVAVVAPPPLGVLTADRVPALRPRPVAVYPPLPSADPVDVSLSDLVVRAAFAATTLHGHELRVIGFVLRATPRGFLLARLTITCCAADAEADEAEIVSGSPAPRTGTWLAAVGTVGGTSSAGRYIPEFHASRVSVIAQPSDPYD